MHSNTKYGNFEELGTRLLYTETDSLRSIDMDVYTGEYGCIFLFRRC